MENSGKNQIRRSIYESVEKHLDESEITLIVGPRQVGKTTLMKGLMEELIKKGEKAIYLSLDDESATSFFESQDRLIERLRFEFGDTKGFVFIDEIQRKENAGLFLKGIYDRNLPWKLVVSGSGSLELKEKIHESLVGRKRVFELLPVGLGEFMDWKTDYRYSGRLGEFARIESVAADSLLREYLAFGGYPRVVLSETTSEKTAVLDELYSSYVIKDISYLLKIDRPESYTLLIKYLAANTGRMLKLDQLAGSANVSVPTVKKYLWYADQTYITRLVTPFFTNKNKELTKMPVPYFLDLGIRRYSNGDIGNPENVFSDGFGFQNLVMSILLAGLNKPFSIHYWRTRNKAEVDFVVRVGNEVFPVEVKASNLSRPVIGRALRSFISEYKPKTALVVNLSLSHEEKIDGTRVVISPVMSLLDHGVSLFLGGAKK